MTRSRHEEVDRNRPGADDERKPETPNDLEPRSWGYAIRRTAREFSKDECTDLAAALTYYAVLAMFPAVIALMSLVGLFGQGPHSVDTLMGVLSDVGGSSVSDTLRPTVEELAKSPGAGIALVLGLAGALWSASGYVGAFGRAMNRIYEVGEGRPVWKLRPMMILVTFALVVLAAIALLGLVLTGPVAQSVGDAIGLGSTAVLVWDIVKWPVMLAVVVVIVAILYWATPNVKQPRFRWISLGAAVAITVWILLTLAFGFYVANFSSYDRTYGSLAGVVVFLLWLWITNLSLLFGAELDAEVERGRELQGGIAAEDRIQLPHRDTRNIEKAEERREDEERRGRQIRQESERSH
jgi:membrane protein